jgi:hypothetical protein
MQANILLAYFLSIVLKGSQLLLEGLVLLEELGMLFGPKSAFLY